MRRSQELEPPLVVDLLWHTHMQNPRRYRVDCIAIAGRMIDHDDN